DRERRNFPARYNVAPTQPVPIVRIVEGQRQFALVRWGLIPPWVKDPRAFALLINARGESVNDRAAFRYAMRRRRCLVPADGFYAWKDEGGRKRPYCVRPRQGGPIAFAGLWETWIGPNGEEMETAIIITTAAKGELALCRGRPRWCVPRIPLIWGLTAGKAAPMPAPGALFGPAPGGAARSLRDFARGQSPRERRTKFDRPGRAATTAGTACRE